MRVLWSGVLSFGLINIPIKLYSATAGAKIAFNYLHKTDLSPIRYAKICRKDGKELTQSDLVKGYEYQDGDYVVLTSDDFKKVSQKKTESIEVLDFVKENEIDSIYFEKPYYLEPDKGAAKSYSLLRESLKKSKKVGLAKFVIHNKEHLGVIKPHEHLLILEQMRFEDELQAPTKLNFPKHESFRAKELSMATSFIDHLTTHFDAADYKDTYRDDLEKIIKNNIKGHKTKEIKNDKPSPTKSTDLMLLLKESLEKAKTQPNVLHA
jgi:DNA end-binding protein Ku